MKEYICIKSFPGIEEGITFTLNEGQDFYMSQTFGLRVHEVENNPEYFELVEEEKEVGEPKSKLWRAEGQRNYHTTYDDQYYYWIDYSRGWIKKDHRSGSMIAFIEKGEPDFSDKYCDEENLWSTGNYYKTEEDAQAVLEYQLFQTRVESECGYIGWDFEECTVTGGADGFYNSDLPEKYNKEFYELFEKYHQAKKNRFTITD